MITTRSFATTCLAVLLIGGVLQPGVSQAAPKAPAADKTCVARIVQFPIHWPARATSFDWCRASAYAPTAPAQATRRAVIPSCCP